MNCPAHCLIYQSEVRSYRDLPLKYADFSPLHRNEKSGALTGMTRVRRFHQDDAHIFTSLDRLNVDIQECINFVKTVYGKFDLTFSTVLSTRPEKVFIIFNKQFIGDIKDWEKAENILLDILKSNKIDYKINPGDGAFYGPKLDFIVKDSLNRQNQLATIQVDFQFPKRFDLTYKLPDGSFVHPIMLHRAILGSIERFLAILIEHYKGKFPFWLSPYQIILLPVNSKHIQKCYDYKNEIEIKYKSVKVDIDDTEKSINKRIRTNELLHYNYIIVIGDKEINENTISVRDNRKQTIETITLNQFEENIEKLL